MELIPKHNLFTSALISGGRLGQGNEESVLTPKPLTSKIGSCLAIALGADHSVFLSEQNGGSVWTCGTNSFHQLGLVPAPPMVTEPQIINGSGSKLPPAALGIGAGRFHSLFWTRSSLFTWGLNAGQLGHLKGAKTTLVPKLVTSLQQKDLQIKLVATR